MTAPTPITADEPTLAERLRFIDLTFECLAQAKAEEVERNGPIYPAFPDEWGPSERSKAIGARISELRFAAMQREGLPFTLLTKRELARHASAHRAFLRQGIAA
jgi:hypothetical protein